jgi:hypothetical protein
MQCVAVRHQGEWCGRPAVCSSVHGSVQCMVVRMAMCGCPVLRQCAAVCGGAAVRVCLCDSAAVYGSAAVCSSARGCVAVRAALCGSARSNVQQCVAVCGRAHGSVWQCALRIYTQSRSQYILVCPYRGNQNEPHIHCI